VTRRSAERLARWTLPVSRVRDTDAVADDLHALHRTLPVRVERSAADFPLILRKIRRQVYAVRRGRRIEAYALVQRWEARRQVTFTVEEVAGTSDGILSLFRWFATRPGVDAVKAEAALAHQPHLATLLGSADGWSTSVINLGQIKAIDPAGIAAAYRRPALAAALRRHGIRPIDQPRLLFGPLPPAVLLPSRAAAAPAVRDLPLPFYLCPSDHV